MIGQKCSSKGGPLVLPCLLAIALLLRLWGLSAGLEGAAAVADEEQVVVRALRFGWGDLNPHWFLYPSLFLYLVFAFFGGYFVVGRVMGVFASTRDFGESFFAHPDVFYLIARSLSALLGTATVLVTYLVCRKLTRNKLTAALSALFLSVSLFHIQESQSAKPDTAMIFLLMISFFFTVTFWEQKKIWRAILAAIFAGLSISTKYTAGVVLFPLFISILGVRDWPLRYRVRMTVLCGCIACGVFFVGTPYALLDFRAFIKWLGWVNGHSELVWRGQALHEHGTWGVYLFDFWPDSSGMVLCLFSLVGIGCVTIKRNMFSCLMGVVPLAYILVMGRSTHAMRNFFTPLIPFLSIYAAVSVEIVLSRFRRRRWKPLATACVVVVACLPSLFLVLYWQYCRLAPATMAEAGRWIEANLPNRSRILAVNATVPVNLSRECLLDACKSPFKDGTVPNMVGSEYTGKGKYMEYLLNHIQEPNFYVRKIPGAYSIMPELLRELCLDNHRSFEYVVFSSLSEDGDDADKRLTPVMLPPDMTVSFDEVVDAYHTLISDIAFSCESLVVIDQKTVAPRQTDSLFFRIFYRYWGRPGHRVEVFRMPMPYNASAPTEIP